MIDEEKRDDSMYRVTKCCGNCTYGGYYKGKQRRMVCIHGISPDPRQKGRPPKQKRVKIDRFNNKAMYDKYPRTHATCVCDNHKWTNGGLKKVENWCGAKPMEDYDGF